MIIIKITGKGQGGTVISHLALMIGDILMVKSTIGIVNSFPQHEKETQFFHIITIGLELSKATLIRAKKNIKKVGKFALSITPIS